MGLITKTITQHVPKRVCTDGSSSSLYNDLNSFDKTVYRVFSMQEDMKTLSYPHTIKNEFDLFIDMATKKTANETYDTSFDQLDEYLGTVGIINDMC